MPGIGCLGFDTPKTNRMISLKPKGASKLLTLQSPDVTVVAWIRIRISPSFGVGFSTYRNSTTSGGPYRSYTIAFMPGFLRLI